MLLTVKRNTSGIYFAELFEREAEDTKHKTGYFGDTGCSWYTKRDGSRQRVIRVRHKPLGATRLKNELFPFTVEGLKAAAEFASTVDFWY